MVDTSGSVDETSLGYARGILEQVLEECNPTGVTLYFVDAKVCGERRLERGEPLTWEPKGGGGTDFTAFFERVERGEYEPVCVVCITDLYATFPPHPPAIPTLWLSTTEGKSAPFGETVYIDR
jgi:predicted metal-dependent peptidase